MLIIHALVLMGCMKLGSFVIIVILLVLLASVVVVLVSVAHFLGFFMEVHVFVLLDFMFQG